MSDNGRGVWAAVVVVVVGLLVVAGVFAGSLANFKDSKDMVAVIGAVTGVVGTIVTAFFGIHATASAGATATQRVADSGSDATQKVADAGSAATKAAVAGQQESHNQALAFAGALNPADAAEVLARLHSGDPPAEGQ
ncbi:MAG: hypothetical protein M3063_00875 [Actinomycetota bacterium]|nr:hypothetical protein [Actinomycetota bacterium]